MDLVKYISHKFSNDYDQIKALALYFDHIDIVDQAYLHIIDNSEGAIREEVDDRGQKRFFKSHKVITTNDFSNSTFKENLQPFLDEKIITFTTDYGENINFPSEFLKERPLPFVPVQKSELIVDESKHLLPKNENNEIYFINNDAVNTQIKLISNNRNPFNKELTYLHNEITVQKEKLDRLNFSRLNYKIIGTSNMLEEVDTRYKNNDFYLCEYLGKIVQSYIDNISIGNNVITTSAVINQIITRTSEQINLPKIREQFKNEFQVDPFLVSEAIKLGVPDLSRFPTEEILDFRSRSRDELLAFKSTLEELTLDLSSNYDADFIRLNASKLVQLKIKPKLDDLSTKLSDSKSSVLHSLIQEIRDPKSYSPLLLTLTNNTSNTLAYMLSLGIISINTALEYFHKHKNAKKDGVYFLFKAKKYFD